MSKSTPNLPIGSRLESVSYALLPGDQVDSQDDFDVVSWAVQLRFTDARRVAFFWLLEEGAGALAHADRAPKNSFAIDEEMSHRWPGVVGQTLTRVVEVQHETDRGLRLWSTRLVFDSARSLVVGLGERGNHGPSYLPDSLIVTDSRHVAENYRVLGTESSAWGTE